MDHSERSLLFLHRRVSDCLRNQRPRGFLESCRVDWDADKGASRNDQRSHSFGQYLGSRYKDTPNIVWFMGNDFQTWSTWSDDSRLLSIANGIRQQDTNGNNAAGDGDWVLVLEHDLSGVPGTVSLNTVRVNLLIVQ